MSGAILGGAGGASTFSALTDKATVDIPGTNAPTANALAGKVSKTGDETIAGVKTFSSAPIVPNGAVNNAALANVAAATVKGNLGGAPGAPTDVALTALAAALGITAGGLGQVRAVKRTASLATVNINTTRGETTRITIPAGILGPFGMLRVQFAGGKSGIADTVGVSVHIGSINSTTNQAALFNLATTQANFVGELIIVGNGVDQSSVRFISTTVPTPTGTATAANTNANTAAFAVNTANAWDIILAFNTGANETATATYMAATVFNPDLANYTASYSTLGGLPSDNAGFAEAVQDVVGALIAAAGGSYNDPGNAIALPVNFQLALSDRTTALSAGTNVMSFMAPYAFTLTDVLIDVDTVSSSGGVDVDVKKNGVSIFSTRPTIDATENSSLTGATQRVITTTAFAQGDRISFDIVAGGTGAKALMATLIGTKP